jgi:hypothetical protein
MRELVTVASAFVIVVGLAFYMYVGAQKHSTLVFETKELHEVVEKNDSEMRQELEALRAHVEKMDSIYHKKNYQ